MRLRGAFFICYNNPGDPPGPSPLPPPSPSPAPTPAPTPRADRLECEGCGCILDSKGKIIQRGEGLRAHLEREDEVKNLKSALAKASEVETELRGQIAKLTPAKKSLWM